MVFQSIEYLLFLSALLATYFWLNLRWQNWLLLMASYAFYGWVTPWWLILIMTTTVVDWACALRIQGSDDVTRRKVWLWLSIGINFTILGVYKYLGFFAENVTGLLASLGLMPSPWIIHLGLPAGISFFTFQSCSYVVDVYRSEVVARRSLRDYALFVAFFPQLVAGPIERAENLLRQVDAPRRPTLASARSGLVLLLWGLFQKVVIADNTALIANKVFSIGDASFPILWAGVIAFGVQIYADFSGYTDMARGSARMLGFELRLNFAHPYGAQTPGEFWRRWHMSLSTWFRDYVYIPLGGSRGGSAKMVRNLLITFFLSGLWHGASWNFILWGCFHGVLVSCWPLVAQRLPLLDKAGGLLGVGFRWLLTYILMHVGWLMFREHNLSMLMKDLCLSPWGLPVAEWRMGLSLAVQSWIYAIPLLVLWPLAQRLNLAIGVAHPDNERWRTVGLQCLVVTALLMGVLALRCDVGSDFIYFQF
jgi:alginate O-acetyltransferase complex protein AlgI